MTEICRRFSMVLTGAQDEVGAEVMVGYEWVVSAYDSRVGASDECQLW